MAGESHNVGKSDIQPVDTLRTLVTTRVRRVVTRIREFNLHFKVRPTSLEGSFVHRVTNTVENGGSTDAGE